VVELAGNLTGSGRRLLDTKLQEVGDQLGRLESRLHDVERRLCLLEDCEVEAEWVSQCLADFDQVWDTLSAENRGRLVRAEAVDGMEPICEAAIRSVPAACLWAEQRASYENVCVRSSATEADGRIDPSTRVARPPTGHRCEGHPRSAG